MSKSALQPGYEVSGYSSRLHALLAWGEVLVAWHVDTQKCDTPKLPHWARGLAWLVLTVTGITNLWGVESTKLNSEHEIVEALGKEAEEQKQEVEEGRKDAAAMQLQARPGQDWTVPGIGLEMAWVRRGTFLMGSPAGEEGRNKYERQHQVTLSRGYWLGKYEVAQGQWMEVMGSNPSHFRGEDQPVESVSWEDVMEFCEKLNQSQGGTLPKGYRYNLPTEAQWEYACRAGTTTATAFGDSLSSEQANFDGNFPYGGASTGPFLRKTASVGSYRPNAWGFYNMHGNVWEWCSNWYGNYPIRNVTDPEGPPSGSKRVRRGGGWIYNGEYCRSAFRHRNTPSGRSYNLGFRLAMISNPQDGDIVEVPEVAATRVEVATKPTVAGESKLGKPHTVPEIGLDMIWVDPGTFLMGSLAGEKDRGFDEMQHRVTLTQGYWLGKYEVTQGQWEAVMGANLSKFKGDKLPVERVSWKDAMDFCSKLNRRHGAELPAGYLYSLPTEAQWEYTCRAGTTTATAFGDNLSSLQANFCGDFPYGGSSKGPYLGKTAEVGSYRPNAWGLYDMHGNVWEWCLDRYGKYPGGSVSDPVGASTGTFRVHRGGCWDLHGRDSRSAARFKFRPDLRYTLIGFRLALSPIPR